MPFELGLTAMCSALIPGQHRWFVFESKERRVQKSLSDLSGTDAYIHNGSVEGTLREIGNALVRPKGPSMPEIMRVYRAVERALPKVMRNTGARSAFEAQAFTELVLAARNAAKLEISLK